MHALNCNLDDCFLCRHCLPEWKEVIALKKTTLSFKKGKKLFVEGEKIKGIFFIYSGTVKIHTQWTDEKELILRFAKKGDIVGLRGLVAEEVYPVSVTALEDTVACHISNEFLEASMRTNPSLTYTLMQLYAMELQKAERRMRDLAHMEVKGRIAKALLEIGAFFGADKDHFIKGSLTRQDIASYAGTTYETVFKFLKVLLKAKVISVSGKRLRIHKEEKLSDLIKNAK